MCRIRYEQISTSHKSDFEYLDSDTGRILNIDSDRMDLKCPLNEIGYGWIIFVLFTSISTHIIRYMKLQTLQLQSLFKHTTQSTNYFDDQTAYYLYIIKTVRALGFVLAYLKTENALQNLREHVIIYTDECACVFVSTYIVIVFQKNINSEF